MHLFARKSPRFFFWPHDAIISRRRVAALTAAAERIYLRDSFPADIFTTTSALLQLFQLIDLAG